MIRTTATTLALAGLLAVPAVGEAATTFGSRMQNEPTDGGCKALVAPCTYVAFIHPSDPNGDPYSGGAPTDGVITKFRIRAYGPNGTDPASVTFRLADVSRTDPDTATATHAATGPTVMIKGDGAAIEEFPASTPVKKGNQLAIDTSTANAIYNSSGSKFSYVYAPPLVAGQGPRASSDVTAELLVQAVIEPDADKDGRGDESQDPFVGTPPDRTKPVIGAAKVSRGVLRYRLSEAARVVIRVERRKRGRYVKVRGKVTRRGVLGANSLKVKRTFAGRKLKPGRYRFVIAATDSAGNRAVKKVRFRIRRG